MFEVVTQAKPDGSCKQALPAQLLTRSLAFVFAQIRYADAKSAARASLMAAGVTTVQKTLTAMSVTTVRKTLTDMSVTTVRATTFALLLAIFFAVCPVFATDAPTITPAGSFTVPQRVTMSASGNTIYYTLDGTLPPNSPSTQTYSDSQPVIIYTPTQINAVAVSSGVYSAVTTVYLDISPSPLLWLKADSGVTTGTGNPGPVTTWTDSSGNNNDATASGNNPRFAANSINKLPAISFDGSSQALSLPSGFADFSSTVITISGAPPGSASTQTITINGTNNASYNASTSDTDAAIASGLASAINALSLSGITATANGAVIKVAAPPATQFSAVPAQGINIGIQAPGATLFVVTAPASLAADANIIDLGDGASGNNIMMQIYSAGSTARFGTFSGTSGSFVQSLSLTQDKQYLLLEAVLTPGNPNATATFYLNGVAGATNSSMYNIPNISRTSNFIGKASSSGSFYSGNIAELLFYPTSLSSSQRIEMESYLLQKYQIFSQVPRTPIISVPSGTLSRPTQVVISTQPGTITRITTDGTDPTSSSPPYCDCGITINYSTTLKAASFKNGVRSSTASATYSLDSSQWPAPPPGDTSAPSINLQLPTQSQ